MGLSGIRYQKCVILRVAKRSRRIHAALTGSRLLPLRAGRGWRRRGGNLPPETLQTPVGFADTPFEKGARRGVRESTRLG